MESPAGSYARSRQPTVLPTVRFSTVTTVSFTAAANNNDDSSGLPSGRVPRLWSFGSVVARRRGLPAGGRPEQAAHAQGGKRQGGAEVRLGCSGSSRLRCRVALSCLGPQPSADIRPRSRLPACGGPDDGWQATPRREFISGSRNARAAGRTASRCRMVGQQAQRRQRRSLNSREVDVVAKAGFACSLEQSNEGRPLQRPRPSLMTTMMP